VRRPFGDALQRLGDDGVHLRVLDRARRTRARGIEQSVQPMLDEPGAPLRDGLLRHPLSARNNFVVGTFGTRQNDACSQRQRLRGLAPQRQCRKLLTLVLGQHQFRLRSSTHRRLVVCTRYTTDFGGVR
jgi:hypothetical protein